MNYLRIVKDDILKDWFQFRDESICGGSTPEDNKHYIQFEEISSKIPNSIPKSNRTFVKKQLEKLDDNFANYLCYWNEKYYRNGFVDGSQLVMGCFEE